jgi:hypothetical protein
MSGSRGYGGSSRRADGRGSILRSMDAERHFGPLEPATEDRPHAPLLSTDALRWRLETHRCLDLPSLGTAQMRALASLAVVTSAPA